MRRNSHILVVLLLAPLLLVMSSTQADSGDQDIQSDCNPDSEGCDENVPTLHLVEIVEGSKNNGTQHAEFNNLDFSPNGSLLARGGYGVIEIFETSDWERKQVLTLPFYEVFPIGLRISDTEFSPDGSMLAATSFSVSPGNIFVWDTNTWEIVFDDVCPGCRVVAFSPDESFLVTGGSGNCDCTQGEGLRVLNTTNWEKEAALVTSGILQNSNSVYSASFSDDGSSLVLGFGGGKGGIVLINTSDWSVVSAWEEMSHVRAISYSGNNVAAGIFDGSGSHLKVYETDGTTMKQIIHERRFSQSTILSLDFSPDGRYLAIGEYGCLGPHSPISVLGTEDWGAISIYHDLQTGSCDAVEYASAVRFSPDGSMLVMAISGYPYAETQHGALGVWIWDADMDRVADGSDQCPGTPINDVLLNISRQQGCSWGQLENDGDGVENSLDSFPDDACASLDTDGDGRPDDVVSGCSTPLMVDVDDDNDGYDDRDDDCPTQGSLFVPDWIDTDDDGDCNEHDLDDDGDGYSDLDESMDCHCEFCDDESDPMNPDDIPTDYDEDLICDFRDSDDDNDGCEDMEDDDPLDNGPDTDGDRIDDDCDDDDDNDGYADSKDSFPLDPDRVYTWWQIFQQCLLFVFCILPLLLLSLAHGKGN